VSLDLRMLPPDYVQRPAKAQITSVDRERLLLLVLEGGAAFLGRARVALAYGDVQGFVADLRRTQDVLLELARTLDRERGEEIAANLSRLYHFMVGHLALVDAERSLRHVDEVLLAYEPIVDAYRRAVGRAPAGVATGESTV
jgi:flagellar secretion chaperone FliS